MPLVLDVALSTRQATITEVSLVETFWTNHVGVIVDGNSLTKNAPNRFGNAGAATADSLASDGFAEFSTAENNTTKVAGLSSGDTDQNRGDVDYGFYLQDSGTIQILESGLNRGSFGSYVAGDTFKVQVEKSKVTYWKNGSLLFTSSLTPSFPLLLDTALSTDGATITDVTLVETFWVNQVGVDASAGELVKTEADGFGNSGASTSALLNGNGYGEFTTNESNTSKVAGLSHGDTDQKRQDIDFAIQLRDNGDVQIWEQGFNRGTVGTYVANDRFRVEVTDGVVSYHKNDSLLYTSTRAPTFPLSLDVALSTRGATLNNVVVSESYWTNSVGVLTDLNSLTKNAPTQFGNAGAVSTESLAGDGFAEFSTAENNTTKVAGLSNGDSDQSRGDIDFGIYLLESGSVQVIESGIIRGTVGTYGANDTFRVQTDKGTVTYWQNDALLYTSAVAPIFPLLFDTALATDGATITEMVVIETYWANVAGVKASIGALEKTVADGFNNSGASTSAEINGDGYAEFSTSENDTSKVAGLSNGDDTYTRADVDFGIFLRSNGSIEIWERGFNRGAFGTYAADDVFRVEVNDGTVTYHQNGALLYTSGDSPTFPLVLDVALSTRGSTIKDVVLTETFWTGQVGVLADVNNLTKNAPNGFGNSGAVTSDSLAGDGYAEFSTGEESTSKVAGLSFGDTDQSRGDIDFGVYLLSTGVVRILENGLSRGDFGTYTAGDVFRVEVAGGVVTYWQNASLLYTSIRAPTFPLLVDTSLSTDGATITDVSIVGTP
jgi:hypothetical protein